MDEMKVGVMDVGSNTVRLLVAAVEGGTVRAIHEERTHLGLGEELVRHGRIRRRKLGELEEVARGYGETARRYRVEELETVVTAPGRQGPDAARLVTILGRATHGRVSVVSPEDEGRLAYQGAAARAATFPGVLGVCDVGGGSTEIVVGTELLGPAWVRSVDIGSLRLTAAHLHGDPPAGREVERARAVVRTAFEGLTPPRPGLVLATGGSARAIARIVGGPYDAGDLERVIETLSARSAEESAGELGVPPHRARTLLAGAVILAEVSRLLELRLTPAKGGIREGAALRLAAERAAAA